jgi:AraC-like DNA-binding protein
MRDRPGDPIADVLRLLRVQSAWSSGLRAGGVWCIRFGPYQHVKFATVLAGQCWLDAGAGREPVLLHAGESYLASTGQAYRLGSDLSAPAADAKKVFARVGDDGRVHHGLGAPVCELLGGTFTFDPRTAPLLLDTLPSLVVIDGGDAAQAVSWAVRQLALEGTGDDGATVMAERLADILLVQALRVVRASNVPAAQRGWLPALGHPQIGPALRLMHAEPSRRWTVAELSREVGMSRSSFAGRFRELVGRPPLEYLQQWRMHAAAEALADGSRTVAAVALASGYRSESAFSAAFQRVIGARPSQMRALARDLPRAP